MRGWRDVVTVRLVYHGHSCFSVEGAAKIIWVDPFLTDNPHADLRPDDITEADYILISHGRGDHLGDAIGQRTKATIISNHEIATYCQGKGVEAHGLSIGGGYQFPFGRVKMTIAHHGSSFPDRAYAGNPGDALRAVELLAPRLVVPMHYNTFKVIQQDPHAFAERVKEGRDANCVVLSQGQSLQIQNERRAQVIKTPTPLLERRRKISSTLIIPPTRHSFSNLAYISRSTGQGSSQEQKSGL